MVLGDELRLLLVARDTAALCVAVARDAPELCVEGVAKCPILICFAWQAWLVALGGALGLVLVVSDAATLRVAGVEQSQNLTSIFVFAWQA